MRRALGFIIFGGIALALAQGAKPTQPPAAPSVSAPVYSAVRDASPQSQVVRQETSTGATVTWPAPASSPTPSVQLASIASTAPLPSQQTAAPRPAAEIQIESARLRKSPGGRAIKGKVPRGAVAVELSRTGTWREVELPDGRRGWLEAKAFEAPEPKAATEAKPQVRELEPPKVDDGLAVAAIAALIVQESRASYGGSCGCPDDRDRAGRRCGGRSAYSRAGGRSLMCYAADVPAALISRRQARR